MLPAPSIYSHAPPQAGFPTAVTGLSQTPVHVGPLGSSGVRTNGRNIGVQTNGPVSHVLPVTLDVVGGYQGGVHELMFVECDPRRNQTGRHHVRSLSAINKHLQSMEGRALYGALSSALHPDNFLARWKLYGVQKPDVMKYDSHDMSVSRTAAVAFVVGKEAKCVDYWRATDPGPALPGADLYLLARRVQVPSVGQSEDSAELRAVYERLADIVDDIGETVDDPTGLLFARVDGTASDQQQGARSLLLSMLQAIVTLNSRLAAVSRGMSLHAPSRAAAVQAVSNRVAKIYTKAKIVLDALNTSKGDFSNASVKFFANGADVAAQWASMQAAQATASPLPRAADTGSPLSKHVDGTTFAARFVERELKDPDILPWYAKKIESMEACAMALSLPPGPSASYQWVLVPYSSPDRTPPHPSLYSGPDWTGAAIFVGISGVTYDNRVRTLRQTQAEAVAVTFAQGQTEYQKILPNLPHIMVYLACGERVPRA